MMLQFCVLRLAGTRWLCAIDTSRYDFMYGFFRPIKEVA